MNLAEGFSQPQGIFRVEFQSLLITSTLTINFKIGEAKFQSASLYVWLFDNKNVFCYFRIDQNIFRYEICIRRGLS